MQATQHRGFGQATPARVAPRLEAYRIIDVREPEEFERDGHIPGARLHPLSRFEEALSSIDPSERILVVCRSGGRSARAAAALAGRGFARVENLQGGMLAWAAGGHPICAPGSADGCERRTAC